MKKYFLKNKKICVQYFILIVMNALIPVLSAQWITGMTGFALRENDDLFYLIVSLGLICVYTLSVYWFYDAIKRKYKESLMVEIEQDMAEAIVLQTQDSFHRYDSSFYTSFFLNDLKLLEESVLTQIPILISGIVQMVLVGFYVVISVNWWVLFYFLISSIILLWIPKLMSKKIQERTQISTEQAGKMTTFLKEMFQGFDVLTGNHVQDVYIQHTRSQFEQYESARQGLNWITSISGSLSNGCGLFFQFILLLILGIGVTQGKVGADYLISITSIASTFMNGVFVVTGAFSYLQTSKPIVKKLKEFQKNPRIQFIKKLPEVQTLSLNGVRYSIGSRTLLNDCSYMFERGKKYLIIGESGSGKTTLFNLLNGRLMCEQGKIEIKGAEEQTLAVPLFEAMTTITQKPASFQGTVKTNIQMFRTITDSRLNSLLKSVLLPISCLEQKIDEDSGSVSGGEMQRISIARALVDSRSFLLCDEITANLDPQSAEIVEQAVTSLKSTGILYIAHHYSDKTLKNFDVVLELKNGKLIERKIGDNTESI